MTERIIEVDDEAPAPPLPEMVTICSLCGRGYPPWADMPDHDELPEWRIIHNGKVVKVSGKACGGRILTMQREAHIEAVGKVLLQIAIDNKLKRTPIL